MAEPKVENTEPEAALVTESVEQEQEPVHVQQEPEQPIETAPAEEPEKAVDTTNPIELTSETIVTVGGKKCVLRVDPATNHLVAYPVAKASPG